jgi:hypothetical protein
MLELISERNTLAENDLDTGWFQRIAKNDRSCTPIAGGIVYEPCAAMICEAP